MRQVTHALLTRPPLSHPSVRKLQGASLDLHVLSTPPAFILSQDQTLIKKIESGQNQLLANSSRLLFKGLSFDKLKNFFELSRMCFTVQLSRNCFIFFRRFCLLFCDSLFILLLIFFLVNTFFQVFSKKKTEKEGFEPSRRFPDLHP